MKIKIILSFLLWLMAFLNFNSGTLPFIIKTYKIKKYRLLRILFLISIIIFIGILVLIIISVINYTEE